MSKPGLYLFTGDLLRDTACLTNEAFGAYCRLLFGPLLQNKGTIVWPLSAFAAHIGTSEEMTRNILYQLEITRVADVECYEAQETQKKWQTDGKPMAKHGKTAMAKLSNRRLVREAQYVEEIRQHRSRAGKKGASKRWQNSDGKNGTPSKRLGSLSSSALKEGGQGGEKKLGFTEFWSIYPKKKSKGDAEEVWRELNPDPELSNRIIEGLNRARSSKDWQKDDGRFIPYPARWLRVKGWEDEGVIFSQTKKSNQPSKPPEPRPSDEEIERGRDFIREQIDKLTHKW